VIPTSAPDGVVLEGCKEISTNFSSFKRDSRIWRWYSRDLGASLESLLSFFSGETGMFDERSERILDMIAVLRLLERLSERLLCVDCRGVRGVAV
jgi:hypothetical protein